MAVAKLTRRSLSASKGRSILIGLTIFLGVSFVAGSFVLADSLRKTFDDLFTGVYAGVDLDIRSQLAFGQDAGQPRDPVPLSLLAEVRQLDGVAAATPTLQRTATIIGSDGKAVATRGAPTYGMSWDADSTFGAKVREGRTPNGPDEVAMDQATADREGFHLGDQVEVSVPAGRRSFTLVGLVGLGNTTGFGGATIVAWDLPTMQSLFATGDGVDSIEIAAAKGTDIATLTQRIEQILPPRTEVVTGAQLAQESKDQVGEFIGVFGNGLLTFAFITLFVSAFIINNVFAITIGQRLRHLALMRAVGASGRQVQQMIIAEAVVVALSATIIGIGGGYGVARIIVALFNSAGAGFPASTLVVRSRTVIVALIVGIGVALAAVIVPSRRAAKIPPVAAMHPEVGFAALTSARRVVVGTVVTATGTLLFCVGIFASPGGTPGLVALGGGGALLLFLGVASLSTTFARPVARALGFPLAKVLGSPGQLARENAARSPRRTASTAAALMIGVALVSAAAVFAASLKKTFVDTLARAISADYIITGSSFQGISPNVAAAVADMPQFDAVTPVRAARGQIDGQAKSIAAINPAAFGKLINIDVLRGAVTDLGDDGLLVHKDPAKKLGLNVGSKVPVTFQNGVTKEMTIAGIFADGSVVGDWMMSVSGLEAVSTAPAEDLFVVAKRASGVTPAEGRAALDELTTTYPELKVQDQAEFRDQREGQIDQLLYVITVLLVFALVIAVLGIAITLALSVFERTHEIGLLRAVGMTRRQTRRMIRWESVIVTVFGGLVGVVLGSLIGVALAGAVPSTVINTTVVPFTTIAFYVLGAAIAGIVAAFYPAAKASRMNVLEAISTT